MKSELLKGDKVMMKESEKIYFETYKQCKDVTPDECYIGGKHCGTCAHCREYDSDFHYFENSYCTACKRK